jgi:citrate lyase subunit beta/citryl-CoA lyase
MIRPRRSLLFMPGSNARALEKARNLPADGIILDLEDSVAPEAKATARDQIAQALQPRTLQFLFLLANRSWTRFLSQALP